ncbi:MAG: hypothetical protein OHK0056_08420 [Bacteriovoracaceae bacterium]
MKKIVIRPSKKNEELISLIPVIKFLKENVENPKIYIIHENYQRRDLNLMPFKLDLHGLDLDKTNVPNIHKWSFNNKDLFNIDIYFDFQNEFKSTFLGFTLRSRERVGTGNWIQKKMLTHFFERPMNDQELYNKAISTYFEKDIKLDLNNVNIPKVRADVMKSLGEETYILLRLESVQQSFDYLELMLDFISKLGPIKIYGISFEGDIDPGGFHKKAQASLNYEGIKVYDHKQLEVLMGQAKGCLTDNAFMKRFCDTYLVPTLLLSEVEDKNQPDLIPIKNATEHVDRVLQFFKL